jgi:NAD(P)-dependent dehydrogenase (short-subunit alcohol dehydrogenase family)
MSSDAEDGIDPDDLAAYLRVLARLDELPVGHSDAVAVRQATAGLFKVVKERRRAERRAATLANDAKVIAATATGAPGRIDDETRGLPLVSGVDGAYAGELLRARGCYVCKARYRRVDAFYHQLCPECAARNRARRNARTDLTGRRALLTGGRAKIGMYIALRLLRDGADTTITTRFPRDAERRFAASPDSAKWLHRLHVVGADLRDPAQVIALADSVSAEGPLDILINNAAQTVQRSAASYAFLAQAEAEAGSQALVPGVGRELVTIGGSGPAGAVARRAAGHPSPHWAPTPQMLTELSLTARSASPARVAAGTAIDAGGLIPDEEPVNSWTQCVEQVDPVELLEVQLCNVTAPFILISRLRSALAASPARRTYIVNVSAMEGQFSRGYKGPSHPHTNMAKAALNMLTRTSAQGLRTDGILMTSVDTGWITDERPLPTKLRLADAGFHAPLDLIDGAARVYDPIVRGEAGHDLYGCFLKDYEPAPW